MVGASLEVSVMFPMTKKITSTFRAQVIFSNSAPSWSAFAIVLSSNRMFLSFGFVIGGVQCSSQSDALRRASMNRSPSTVSVCSDCGAKATISLARSSTKTELRCCLGRKLGEAVTHEGTG